MPGWVENAGGRDGVGYLYPDAEHKAIGVNAGQIGYIGRNDTSRVG